MTINTELIKNIAAVTPTCDEFAIVQPVNIGRETWGNELLLFVKPEIFLVEKTEYVEAALQLVFAKLAEFKAHVSGVAIVGGKVLEEAEIMNRHYGFINRLSRFASTMIDAGDRKKIAEALGVTSIDALPILGGHEYLKAYPSENCLTWIRCGLQRNHSRSGADSTYSATRRTERISFWSTGSTPRSSCTSQRRHTASP